MRNRTKTILAGIALALIAGTGTSACEGGLATVPKQLTEVAGALTTTAPASAPTGCPDLKPVGKIGTPIDTAAMLTALDCLPVKGRAGKVKYKREDKFGAAWSVKGANGCDTQSRILVRDLTAITYKSRCTVMAGTLNDPYTGKVIHYVKGQKTPDGKRYLVELDHLVPVDLSMQKGAQQWPQDKRVAFANDMDNVLAVDGPANGQKSNADAATWLPPNKNFRKEYAARIVYITWKYGLWLLAPEKAALNRLLRGE